MISLITLLAIMGYTGTVDRVENNIAHVVFVLEGSEDIATDIPVALLPCEISEGDKLYVKKTEHATEIRCTEAPPTANVQVNIDPATGEVEYRITGIEIELE